MTHFATIFQEITLTKHKKLNLDRKPCEDNVDYSFTNCIKQEIFNQVSYFDTGIDFFIEIDSKIGHCKVLFESL